MRGSKCKAVTDYWLKFYVEGVCTLCGNSGYVDTRKTAVSPLGVKVGRRQPCICPNGQENRVILMAGTFVRRDKAGAIRKG